MSLVLVTAPTVEPLTATEVKTRLGIGTEIADATIEAYIKAARQGIERRLQISLNTQTWRLSIDDGFPACAVKLPRPPLLGITSVKYTDTAGILQTLASDQYQTFEDNGEFYLDAAYSVSWPSSRTQRDAVVIEYTAGFGASGSNVPEPIRQAIVLLVNHQRSMGTNLFISNETEDGVGSTSYVVGGNAGQAIDNAVQSLLGEYRVYA